MSPNLDKETITDCLRAHQSELRGLGVARLGLFGSFVRDEGTPESDVDILVEFEAGKKSFTAFMELGFWLEDALRQPVELVTPESLGSYLAPHILPTIEYVLEQEHRAVRNRVSEPYLRRTRVCSTSDKGRNLSSVFRR